MKKKFSVYALFMMCVITLAVVLITAHKEKVRLSAKTEEVMSSVQVEQEKAEISSSVEVVYKSATVEYIRRDIPMPVEDQELLYKACLQTGCTYATALSVCWVETGMRNIVGDNGNSFGYMQIQPKWVQQRMKELGVTDLMDSYSNFLVGTSILAEYINEYGTVSGLTKYNSGHTGKSAYAEKVLKYREALESEYN